ncbi:MAG: class I SAM-dependent methyltransferase [Verrucomicrobiota bacterium]
MPSLGPWPADGLESVPRCPVCGSDQRKLLYRDLRDRVFGCAPGLWELKLCLDCGSGYLDPRPTPATIGAAYKKYPQHAAPVPIIRNASGWRGFRDAQRNGYANRVHGYNLKPARAPWFVTNERKRRFDAFVSYLAFPGEGARLLDIGCGNGKFLLQLRSLGWDVHGVEPDPESAAHGRAAGLDVRNGLLQEQAWPEGYFDAVTMNHVVEHLHDPPAILRHCWRLLKPGGCIRLITPNLGSWGRQYFGSNWLPLDPPRHLVLFTEPSLRRALEGCGFSVSRPPRAIRRARATLQQSTILRLGGEPMANNFHLPFRTRVNLRWLAWQADRASAKEPARAEELILLGRKTKE